MQSNTDTQFIGSGEAVKAAVFYITEYITKGDLPLYVGLQALDYATKMHDAKYAEDENTVSEKRNHNLITKSVNAMMGHQETSHQQVMSYLIGGGDVYTSHTFQTVKWYEFMNAVDRFDMECACREGGEASQDVDDVEQLQEEYVTMNISTQMIEFSSDMADYILCPLDAEPFSDLCLWQFIERTIKVRGDLPVEEPDEECDDSFVGREDSSRKCGRKMLPRAKFVERHSQFGSHILQMREKYVIPVLLGDAIPWPDRSSECYERYCRAMMVLFKPWRDFETLKGENDSWTQAFEKESFPPAILSVISNMNIENECKDARDTHAAVVREECAKPHVFGNNVTEHMHSEEDMAAFNDALLADTSLDPTEDEGNGDINDEHPQISVDVKNIEDVKTCLRAAKDGGLFGVLDVTTNSEVNM